MAVQWLTFNSGTIASSPAVLTQANRTLLVGVASFQASPGAPFLRPVFAGNLGPTPVFSGAAGAWGVVQYVPTAVAQQVVHPLRQLADESLTHGHDTAIGDGPLLGDGVRLVVPAGRLKPRHHKFSTRVCFTQHRS